MTSGHNITDGFGKTRPALADVSNRKREFSGDLGLKSADGYGKNVAGEDGDSQFAKQVCLGLGNLAKEECKTKFGVDGSEKELSSTRSNVGASRENITSVVANLPDASKEASTLFDDSVQLVKGDTVQQSVVEVGDAKGDSCMSSVSMPTCSGPCQKDRCEVGGKCQDEEGRLTSGVTQSKTIHEGLVMRVCKDDENDIGDGKLASSNYGSVEWSRLPKSQSSKFHELERCTGLKGDGCDNQNAGAEFLKGCSCSFCLKAAYIWSDLHYQDIRGRIAVLKKSQKETSLLVEQSCKGKETNVQDQGNFNKLSKSESDLTGHWRSLFIHMEDILARESNQLQANFVKLKDLRENCKTDLEMINGMTSDKH
ncbi:uncharacterized protein LOC133857832 [Alnus glutinosa]|uniref:uncharacterized protein LOC133857832 n=1 Tax=Alnus glutinosa TaxID=3517 RepID=UPI002D776C72|nr:uncharacterized protein LOC133857832 [Alnus glutinosa]